ncbi:MAG TPA: radical SAM/SPASM domain-containing protein [Polyangiaceae bacterium]|nr:radical SAM/SPASM domain-containing protein [Polyangiaceae bacterium]
MEAIAREPLLLEPLRRSVHEDAAPAYLRSLKLKLTARCNLKCVMCRYGRGWAPPELTTQDWTRVLTEARELGCRKVHFSGGEVLVRPDFEELVAVAAREQIKVTFTSNLTLLTKERAKRLLRHKIGGISTSLDGASAKVHERVRGIPGSFKRTLRALAWIRRYRSDARPRLRINFVMMRSNFRDYPALLRLAGDLGAVDVVPMPVDTKQSRLRLSQRLIREYNETIAPEVSELRRALGMPVTEAAVYPFGRVGRELALSRQGEYASGYYVNHLCYAPYLHAFAAWDGKVYLCCMTNGRIEALGDLSQQSLKEVFWGEPFRDMRRSMLSARLRSCHACDMVVSENRALDLALRVAEPDGAALDGAALDGAALDLGGAPSSLMPPARRLPLLP